MIVPRPPFIEPGKHGDTEVDIFFRSLSWMEYSKNPPNSLINLRVPNLLTDREAFVSYDNRESSPSTSSSSLSN